MPPVARYRIAAIGALARHLKYAPAETRRRQMLAAERLVAEIDRAQNYPEPFVVWRVTGYRPEPGDETATFVGEALLGDLVTLIQQLSFRLDVPEDDAGRRAVRLKEVARALNVSIKTLQRYRRQGLILQYVVFAEGGKTLACFEDEIRRFAALNGRQLAKAASFSRVDSQLEQQMIEQARRMREDDAVSLNEAALRLARRHGRAHETVRAILSRHDRSSPRPIFSDRGPLGEHEIRLIHRAWQMGVSIDVLCRRLAKARATIHRAINRRRGELLRACSIEFVTMKTFDRADAESVILSSPPVRSGLNEPGLGGDALSMIEALDRQPALSEDAEQSLAAAFNYLKRRAAGAIAGLGSWPGALELDAIETDLRWAALLKRRLVASAIPGALRRVEAYVGRKLSLQPGDRIVVMMRTAVLTASRSVESLNPGRRHRLNRVCGLAMDRALAAMSAPRQPDRAAARHAPGAVRLVDPLALLCEWSAWLDLPPARRAAVERLSGRAREVIEWHYGLGGEPPQRIHEIARRTKVTESAAARLVQNARAKLRVLARER